MQPSPFALLEASHFIIRKEIIVLLGIYDLLTILRPSHIFETAERHQLFQMVHTVRHEAEGQVIHLRPLTERFDVRGLLGTCLYMGDPGPFECTEAMKEVR